MRSSRSAVEALSKVLILHLLAATALLTFPFPRWLLFSAEGAGWCGGVLENNAGLSLQYYRKIKGTLLLCFSSNDIK